MSLSRSPAEDVQVLLHWLTGAPLHGVKDSLSPTEDEARQAAARLADDAQRRLVWGLSGADVRRDWPATGEEFGVEIDDRLEAAEAKVEAARALVGRWRVNSGVGLGAYQLRRELADELSAVLDPPGYEVVCSRCGKTVATMPRAIGEGFEDARHQLTESLRDHFESCEGAES